MSTEVKSFTKKQVKKLLGHFKLHIHQINHNSISWQGGVSGEYIFIGETPFPSQGDLIMMDHKIKVKHFELFDCFIVYTSEYRPLFIYHKPKSEDN